MAEGTQTSLPGLDAQDFKRLRTVKIQRQQKGSSAPTNAAAVSRTEEMQQVLNFFTGEMMAAHEELLKRARALEEANHRLEEIDQLKTRLLGEVAHELRAPLTSILLKLDLIERGQAENRPRYVNDVRTQVRRLGHMIEEILDMTRIYMTNPAERFVDVDLGGLLNEALDRLHIIARHKQLSIVYQPPSAPVIVRGEREQIVRIFDNLIGNAIKYTPSGGVDIRVEIDRLQREVCVVVQDTGIGIAAEDIPHLFDRFHRGTLTAKAGIQGTGLGLAIVKDILDVHGGRITVESKPGVGSTFRVMLPISQ
jgi:two-component system phosphate regulon sensor histidine kinase PhoR